MLKRTRPGRRQDGFGAGGGGGAAEEGARPGRRQDGFGAGGGGGAAEEGARPGRRQDGFGEGGGDAAGDAAETEIVLGAEDGDGGPGDVREAPPLPRRQRGSWPAAEPGGPERAEPAGARVPRPAPPAPEPEQHTVHGVVHEPGGRPLDRAVLTLIAPGGRQLARTATRADGHYALAAPGPGAYVLIVAAAGHRPVARSVALMQGTEEVDVQLGGVSRLHGTVRTDGGRGEGVAGAVVILTDLRGEVVASTDTDAAGGYRFGELLPGEYTLAVSADGHRPAALAVEVAGGAATVQDVGLEGGACVAGVVRTRAGRPVEEARVTLVDERGDVVATLVTGEDGRFRFTGLPAGEYTLIAAGYPPVAAALGVGARPVESDVVLAP